MHTPDEDNIIFKTAADFINNSNHPVFLTGKAGTGKTTFLKYIKEHTRKNTVIVAPTGVAAINAGGTTIHSFFQLPFTPFIPFSKKIFGSHQVNDKHNLLGKLKLSSERREIMEQLELLIIDEISMVRCDVLDAIDTVLRYVRKQQARPFGGVQVLYIGDMYQLPPVVKDEEWQLLSSSYDNQYFFSSQSIAEQQPVYIELKKVYRQRDTSFISLLNQVRNNEMDEDGYALLHSRFMPDFNPISADSFITLTTHNNKADAINSDALSRLHGRPYSFHAQVQGSFFENAFPADEVLNLKIDSQVMFIKNDTEKIRRYYNGKIGTVQKIEEDKIFVVCKQDSSELIEVKKETWKNIRYSLNNKTQQIEEEELGSFIQYPLRLAWAITIHKSQGLTFEKAIIDAGKAFAPGQVYVALSRCTSLEGIILHSKISYDSLNSDQRIVDFSSKQQGGKIQEQILFNATRQYQQDIIRQSFHFKNLEVLFEDLSVWVKENNHFGEAVSPWLEALKINVAVFNQHSEKFSPVLDDFFKEDVLPENNELLIERFKKASSWFFNELLKMKQVILQSPAVTDNRQFAKDYSGRLQKIFDLLCYQIHLFDSGRNGFSLTGYREQKAAFKKDIFPVNAYAGKSGYIAKDVSHPDLYNALRDKRNEICNEKNMPVYMVCSTQSLEEMTLYLPQSLPELAKINGFGSIKINQYGKDFINIILDYCELNNLTGNISDIPLKRIRKPKEKTSSLKPDTKKTSFDLYKNGLSIPEIATQRSLAASTIESHLGHYIGNGELDIDKLLGKEKQEQILDVIKKSTDQPIKAIKEQLPDSVSYGELRWMIALEKKNG